ncbi:MAG: class I SAM-dependent methyltransferase, partial [Pseudomonadota bacterium]
VGMFEHVGVGYFDEYFAACRRLMKDDGVMLLHSIGRTGPPGYTAPFIAKYIFPGGYIPSLSEVLPAIERAGLYVTDIEIWRLHYASTLQAWNERFQSHKDEVIALRDERFFRMWEFYLAGSEAAFRAGDMMVFQIQIAKTLETVPLTRDYMSASERALAARDSGRASGPALVAKHG